MNLNQTKTLVLRMLREHPIWFAGAAVFILAVLFLLRPRNSEQTVNAFYTVKRGDFLISIVEGGTLQAVNEISIRNDVEGTSRIIYIVPEGTYVKKGDLLVELDSSNARDQVNQQLIAVEKAQFALIQAKEQLEIQKSIVESEIRAAELKLEFAQTDLRKYLEGEAKQERRKAEIEIASIMEKMAIDEERLRWSEKLHEKGFETKSKLDQDRLTLLQTKLNLETATNNLWMLEQFDHPKKRRQYESAVEEARKELERVKQQGEAKLSQYKAEVRTSENTLELSKAKLERDQKNLEATKIYAPQDGLVSYPVADSHFSSESLIEEGATVRNRQVLVKLPDTSEMKVTVKIHESHVNKIRPGLPAFVVLDSRPDERFQGVVSKVALLPDTQSRWGNPNLKVYATEILIKDKLPDVKPGVSARAEIIVTNLHDVIAVPIQAVTTKQGRPVVYVADGEDSRPVPVVVGMYNTKFIEIASGLKDGDRILLAPPFDTQERDLGGAVVGEGEKATATNLVARTPPASNGSENNNGNGKPAGADAAGLLQRPQRDGAPPAGNMSRPNFDELRKQFDKNGDGQLDEEERAAMRAAMRERYGTGPGPGGGMRPGRQPGGSDAGEGTRREREPGSGSNPGPRGN